MIWHSALMGIASALSLVANRINAKRLTIGYRAADSCFNVPRQRSKRNHGAGTHR